MSSHDLEGESCVADFLADPKVYGDLEHYGWTTEEEEDYEPKVMEDQPPAAEEEDIQPLLDLFTPTEIEAFKMIELARIQNKYLTQENILLKGHIVALKGIIRKLDDLLRSMCDYPPSSSPPSSPPRT